MNEKPKQRRIQKVVHNAGEIKRILATCLIMGLLPIQSAQDQKKDHPVLQHDVSVTLKLIQVHVTDKKGRPVTDLAREDFEVFDKGKKVDITDFESHVREKSGGVHLSESAAKEKAALSFTRNYFLFFDFSNNDPDGIREAKKAALDFIDNKLDSSARIGVLSYSPVKMLKIHAYLTDDHMAARNAVEKLVGIEETFGSVDKEARNVELKILSKEYTNKYGENGNPYEDELNEIEDDRDVKKNQTRSFTASVKTLAMTLAKVPGRKNILFFSAGIPGSFFTETFIDDPRFTMTSNGATQLAIPEIDTYLTDQYRRMVRELAAANCAVFPIYASEDKMSKTAALPGYLARQITGESALQDMADKTGGKLFNTIRGTEEIMESISDITGSYYVLGYSIREEKDGKYHKIKVSVKRKDCDVHVPSGYYAPKEFSQYSKLERALHFLELASSKNPETRLEFPFAIDAYPCLFEDSSGFVLLAKFPASEFEKISGKSTEISEIVQDESGSVRESRRGIYDLRDLPEKDVHYYSGCRIPPGRYTSKIIIRNLETGQAARSETPVDVSWPGESGVSFYKPLLLAPAEETLYLKGAGAEHTGENDASRDLLLSVFPMVQKTMVPVEPPYRFGQTRLYIQVQCRINELEIDNLQFDLVLKSSVSGTEVKPRYQSKYSNIGGKALSLFTEIDLLTVPSGGYTLQMSLADIVSGKTWMTSIGLTIE